jgi:hypothetical protein
MSGTFPLRYVHRNILIGPGGDSAALYRLQMTAYPFLANAEKWTLQRRLQRLAHTISADFSIWRVNRSYPADTYVASTIGLLDSRHQEDGAWRAFLEDHRDRLRELGSHIPEVFLAVSLASKTPVGVGAALIRGMDRARRRLEELSGIGSASPISASEISELAAQEQRVYDRVRGVLAARRARTVELQWLLHRAACRGVKEPDLDGNWSPDALIVNTPEGGVAFEPLTCDLERCANAAITEEDRTLIVDGEHGRSYQALLALGSLADSPQFPGAGAEVLFAPLESVPWPVDAVLHAQWLGNRQALAVVRKRIADVEHAYQEQLQGAAHGPTLLAGEDRILAREYEAQLQAGGHPPMLYAFLGLAVGAPSSEELERRVTVLAEHYGDIALHRPAGLQHRLWLDHLPRPDGWL